MKPKFFLAITAVIACCSAGMIASAQSGDLFVVVPQTQIATMPAEQRVLIDKLRLEKTTRSLAIIRMNLASLERANVDVGLRADLRVRVAAQRTDKRTDTDYSWYGTLTGTPGVVTLVVRGQNVTGTIRSGRAFYRIRPLGTGFHALIEVDESKFPPEEPASLKRTSRTYAPRARQSNRVIPHTSPFSTLVIEVLVAYTASAASASGDILGLIQLAVDETNQSYQNSGVNMQLHLAHTHQVDYDESKDDYDKIVEHLRECDNVMDDVHAVRDVYAADVVVLLVDRNIYCGKSAAEMAAEDSAFCVVHYDCAHGYYSFAHEIGHLQGADHEPEFPTLTPFPYGHGYHQGSDWRTIMSVGNFGPRLQYWSNPNVSYGGFPMGTAATHHDARVLNETAAPVAAFRPLQPTIPFVVGTFKPWPGYGIPNGLWRIADINGDGKADVIHAVQSDLSVNTWISQGNGAFNVVSFKPWTGYGIPNGVWLTGDINGDGKTDIVHAVQGTGGVNTWISQGNGTYNVVNSKPWAGYGIPNGVWITGDINGDGKTDIVHAVQGTGGVNTWISLGNGTYNVVNFKPWAGYGIPNGIWMIGDINGDGKADIAHAVQGTGGVNTWISLGNGTYSVVNFKPWAGYGIPNGIWMMGDIDGDGKADIVHAVKGAGNVNTWMSQGNGTYNVVYFQPWAGYGIPNGIWMTGDINGDGKADIVHAVQGTEGVNTWISQGNGHYDVSKFKPWSCYGIPRGLWLIGDISGDGKADLVHAVQNSDYVHPWISP